MINIENVTKTFGEITAVDALSATIGDGSIYGLIGSNGSGKSTLLKMMCGAIRADSGIIKYDNSDVYENPHVKQGIVFLSDEQYFLPSATLHEMAGFYASLYTSFSWEKYSRLAKLFGLNVDRKISTYSKGMKKQVAILLGLSSCPKYLLCDETFDGVDPVMRQLVKKLLASEIAENGMTAVIASHNLREIEDICDHIGLLHRGGILFESELDSLKREIHAVQMVCVGGAEADNILKGFHIVSHNKRGTLSTVVVRGEVDELRVALDSANLKYYEIIPLTLEEIFISEMEERGYDYSDIIL